MKAMCIGLLAMVVLSGCGPVKNAVNPYEENFRCKAKDSEGKCIDTPAAYREALRPDGQDVPRHGEPLDGRQAAGAGEAKKRAIRHSPEFVAGRRRPVEDDTAEAGMVA